MSASHPDGELLGEVPKKSTRGRPRKPDAQERVAAMIGVSRRTLARAQAHLQAIQQYPELETSTLAKDKQIVLAKQWRLRQSHPWLAQYLRVEAIGREIRVLTRKLARAKQRYAEEQAKLSALPQDTGSPRGREVVIKELRADE
jgi:hypothetical protein